MLYIENKNKNKQIAWNSSSTLSDPQAFITQHSQSQMRFSLLNACRNQVRYLLLMVGSDYISGVLVAYWGVMCDFGCCKSKGRNEVLQGQTASAFSHGRWKRKLTFHRQDNVVWNLFTPSLMSKNEGEFGKITSMRGQFHLSSAGNSLHNWHEVVFSFINKHQWGTDLSLKRHCTEVTEIFLTSGDPFLVFLFCIFS